MSFLSHPYRVPGSEVDAYTPSCGGYAALAWGYDYLSPTGITAATPLYLHYYIITPNIG
jgi:hypothetical protein